MSERSTWALVEKIKEAKEITPQRKITIKRRKYFLGIIPYWVKKEILV